MFTAYHAKYFAYDLTKRSPYDSPDKIGQALVGASVDLNPHQVAAALFALKNPLGKGAILADEVGLGKTIEAGLVISQFWAEGKRSILILVPKSLRHQWQDELENLFHLSSEVIDGATFRKIQKKQESDPLQRTEKILICNEHFVASYGSILKKGRWDLVIIDEAHKLRNVWKPGEKQAKRAKAIREALEGKRKLLLTATPMQNSLMELYGLTTFIDDHILGTPESFSAKFMNVPDEHRIERYVELRNRLGSCFHRELRKNISEYIQYTNRKTATFYYSPDDNEERLRIEFEEFLRRPVLLSVPQSALHLLKLIYLKLLASSSFALKNSLLNLYKRLVLLTTDSNDRHLFDELIEKITKALTLENGRKTVELERFEERLYYGVFPKTFEGLRSSNVTSLPDDLETTGDEIESAYTEADHLSEDTDESDEEVSQLYDPDLIREESESILSFILLARKISDNKKANALISALQQQFKKAQDEGWPEKAVIFTEFRTTQNYVLEVLESIGLDRNKDVVVFNGSSGDVRTRKALVEQFHGDKKIFLTTEAGAEGLNLQCCNLIVNYDLPWNPQRIEQRIGRCHRYGQKLDVVVVNFINTKNYADVRVLELLTEKFKLFEGAFGASDEVLGQLESGHDVEREIYKIYLECRTEDEIKRAFDELQNRLKIQIEEKIKEAHQIIVEHFDEDVQKKLKMQHEHSVATRDEFTANFWRLCRYELRDHANFDDNILSINLINSPIATVRPGTYVLRAGDHKAHSSDLTSFAVQHPLGEWSIKAAKERELGPADLKLNYSDHPSRIGLLDSLQSKSGILGIWHVNFESLQPESHLIALGMTDDGEHLTHEVCSKLFRLKASESSNSSAIDTSPLDSLLANELKRLEAEAHARNQNFFSEEIERLDAWSEDLKDSLEIEIKKIDKEIALKKREAKSASVLAEKVELQRSIKSMESKRNKKRRELFDEQDRIEKEKDELLRSLETKLKLKSKLEHLFYARWELT